MKIGGAAFATPALTRTVWAQDVAVCKIAHPEAIGSPFSNAFEKWTALLNERSAGRIDAQHFPARQPGGLAQLLEMSRIGTMLVPPHITGREALRVHALIDAITRSAATGALTTVEALCWNPSALPPLAWITATSKG